MTTRTTTRARTRTTRTRTTLTDHQEAALDLLLDVIEAHGQPGAWPDGEPAAPLDLWRTKMMRTLFPAHANPRQMVRRTVTALVRLGVVLERDGPRGGRYLRRRYQGGRMHVVSFALMEV